MIVFNCPECGKEFRVEDSFVGRKGKCTDCRSRFVVPAPGGAAEPAAPKAPGSPSSSTELRPYQQPARAVDHGADDDDDDEDYEEDGAKKQLPLIVGAGVGGVVLLGLIAAFALSGSKGAPPAPPPETFVSGKAPPAPSPGAASASAAAERPEKRSTRTEHRKTPPRPRRMPTPRIPRPRPRWRCRCSTLTLATTRPPMR